MGFRNDLVVKTLREFPNPPNFDRNEGVRAMRNAMEQRNLHLPFFVTYPDLPYSVKLILRNEERSDAWNKVQAYLEREIFIDNTKAREVSGITGTEEMSRMLSRWVAEGLLQRMSPTGSKRKTMYVLPSAKIV